MFTANALVIHVIGDFVIQSDWMAMEKTKTFFSAFWHAVSYTVLFAFLTTSPYALAFICITHFIIDKWRLARYVCWAKNFLAPKWISYEVDGKETRMVRNLPFKECEATGYLPGKPPWMSFWLMIIADNTLHICCNAIALRWL